MKIDAYKNKKPILVKFFQLTVLLIGSAFFTAQADFPATNEKFFDSSRAEKTDDPLRPRATVYLLPNDIWRPGDYNSCYMGFNLFISDPNNPYPYDDNWVPYEITVVYDNRKISLNGETSGSITFSGDHPSPDGDFIYDFEIYANPPFEMVFLDTTVLKAFGTLNGIPVHDDGIKIELPYYWYPYCQIR